LGWNTDCQHSFITFGENVHLPFLNSFALSRAPKVMKGATWHCLPSFSGASSKTGLTIIDAYGYQANWFVMGSLGFSRWQAASGCKTRQKKKTIPIVILWAPPLLKGKTKRC
jgi:hypothetical protein